MLPRPDDIGPGIWLGCPDGREVHLLLQDVPENLGQHYAFEVASVDDTSATLSGAGRKVSKSGEIAGVCKQVFCRDPSGNLVEFNERI